MSSRAQIFSLDLILAIVIFISILLSFYSLGDYSFEKIIVDTEDGYVNEVSQHVANLLVGETLVGARNEIDEERLASFLDSDYNQTKKRLGAPDVAIRISLYDYEENLLHEFGEAPGTYTFVHITDRLVVYRGDPVRLRVEVLK